MIEIPPRVVMICKFSRYGSCWKIKHFQENLISVDNEIQHIFGGRDPHKFRVLQDLARSLVKAISRVSKL